MNFEEKRRRAQALIYELIEYTGTVRDAAAVSGVDRRQFSKIKAGRLSNMSCLNDLIDESSEYISRCNGIRYSELLRQAQNAVYDIPDGFTEKEIAELAGVGIKQIRILQSGGHIKREVAEKIAKNLTDSAEAGECIASYRKDEDGGQAGVGMAVKFRAPIDCLGIIKMHCVRSGISVTQILGARYSSGLSSMRNGAWGSMTSISKISRALNLSIDYLLVEGHPESTASDIDMNGAGRRALQIAGSPNVGVDGTNREIGSWICNPDLPPVSLIKWACEKSGVLPSSLFVSSENDESFFDTGENSDGVEFREPRQIMDIIKYTCSKKGSVAFCLGNDCAMRLYCLSSGKMPPIRVIMEAAKKCRLNIDYLLVKTEDSGELFEYADHDSIREFAIRGIESPEVARPIAGRGKSSALYTWRGKDDLPPVSVIRAICEAKNIMPSDFLCVKELVSDKTPNTVDQEEIDPMRFTIAHESGELADAIKALESPNVGLYFKAENGSLNPVNVVISPAAK